KWTAEEVRLAEATADRTWAALVQARAEASLRASEEKYYTLFDSMDEGYCIIQMVYDSDGKAVDWRFIETNSAFHKQNGLPESTGKKMKELVPDIEQKWVDLYNSVAVSGKSLRIEESSVPLGRTFDLYAFRVGKPEERKVAVLFTDITQRKKAERALAESEENYQTLFNSIDQGFCTIEVVFNEEGVGCDYIILQVNEAFVKQTGLVDVIGRRISEILPGHESHWYETYGEVVKSGESTRFENVSEELGRYYDVYAFPIGKKEEHRVGVLFQDVADRKRREANQELLVRVADRLADTEHFMDTLGRVAEKVGLHFRAKHCMFGEVMADRSEVDVLHSWNAEGKPSLVGVYQLLEFMTPRQVDDYLSGTTT
ncbi:MAG: PAS domain-containing protein, partial [Verrucomicrobiaceae bacterium]